MSEERKQAALERATKLLAEPGADPAVVLAGLWTDAYEQGRLDALDELQDRFCVCMK